MSVSLHPLIDNGLSRGNPDHKGGKLHCRCHGASRVEVVLGSNIAHNHACGCSQCWKPKGANFSVVGVVPSEHVHLISGGDKLQVVNKNAVIRRYACRGCGVHMFGRIEQDHPFKGLDFVHAELGDEGGWQEPQFAAFCSSIIEQGFDPDKMGDVRKKLNDVGLQTYDCLSPALMDLIAKYTAKQAGTFKSK